MVLGKILIAECASCGAAAAAAAALAESGGTNVLRYCITFRRKSTFRANGGQVVCTEILNYVPLPGSPQRLFGKENNDPTRMK